MVIKIEPTHVYFCDLLFIKSNGFKLFTKLNFSYFRICFTNFDISETFVFKLNVLNNSYFFLYNLSSFNVSVFLLELLWWFELLVCEGATSCFFKLMMHFMWKRSKIFSKLFWHYHKLWMLWSKRNVVFSVHYWILRKIWTSFFLSNYLSHLWHSWWPKTSDYWGCSTICCLELTWIDKFQEHFCIWSLCKNLPGNNFWI